LGRRSGIRPTAHFPLRGPNFLCARIHPAPCRVGPTGRCRPRAERGGSAPTGGPRLTVSQMPCFAATHVCGLPVGPPCHHLLPCSVLLSTDSAVTAWSPAHHNGFRTCRRDLVFEIRVPFAIKHGPRPLLLIPSETEAPSPSTTHHKVAVLVVNLYDLSKCWYDPLDSFIVLLSSFSTHAREGLCTGSPNALHSGGAPPWILLPPLGLSEGGRCTAAVRCQRSGQDLNEITPPHTLSSIGSPPSILDLMVRTTYRFGF
jgi:hypothetical protein